MTFSNDDRFSKHKDILLKPYWGDKSYEGRFVIVGSELLQKKHGIDVILQSEKDNSDIKIDTKHVRGKYNNFYLEEMSCPERGTLGWILKEDGWPDWIFYCFWEKCFKCYKNCFECDEILLPIDAYVMKFIELREWFMRNGQTYQLHTNETTINKTNGRLVPVADLLPEIRCKHVVIGEAEEEYEFRETESGQLSIV